MEHRLAGDNPVPEEVDARLHAFQQDAVSRARAILARRGGVLIADSVGLGKTHVALALLRSAIATGSSAAVIAPAALKRHWRRSAEGIEVDWISYAALSRDRVRDASYELLVFDEAHALRNPATSRYRSAARLCRSARVVLLSATPINNSPWDLYHMLRLFAGDRDFLDVGVPSLHSAFAEAAGACALGAAPALQPVLREVMIRRTRPFLREQGAMSVAGLAFPDQRAPVPIRYEFGPSDGRDLLESIGAAITELEFPAHRDRDARWGATPVALLRLTMFKRLESSVYAFRRSLDAYDALLRRCLEALDHGVLLRAGDARIGENDGQLRFDELLFEPIQDASDADESRCRIERERTALDRARDLLSSSLDLKLEALLRLLSGELRGRKALLFTQYRDTARYLHSRLCRRFRVAIVDGCDARLGQARAHRLAVIRAFAPRSNGAPSPAPSEAVDVLITTDVLSEGFNLQDAEVVISYDLPWNPIRLVQRIGRIDRLGSPHASIGSYHFLPGDLEKYLRLLDRIAWKTAAIEATVGSDVRTLHAEVVRALDRRDPGVIARVEAEDSGWFEIDERLQAALARVRCARDRSPAGFAVGLLPRGTREADTSANEPTSSLDAPSGLVAATVGGRFEWVAVRAGVPVLDDRACAQLIEKALGLQAPGQARPARGRVEALLAAARPILARRAAATAVTPLLPAGGLGARIGRRLLELATALPGGPDPSTCRRIEACFERIARLSAPALEELSSRVRGPTSIASILDAIERAGPSVPIPVATPVEQAGNRPRGDAGVIPVRLIGALLEYASER